MNIFNLSSSNIVTIHIFSFMVFLYCICRLLIHKAIILFIGELKFYTYPKYRELVKGLVFFRISPWPHWDEDERQKWEDHWWIYLTVGIISLIIMIYTLFLTTK